VTAIKALLVKPS